MRASGRSRRTWLTYRCDARHNCEFQVKKDGRKRSPKLRHRRHLVSISFFETCTNQEGRCHYNFRVRKRYYVKLEIRL
jgi:hypothetical protein